MHLAIHSALGLCLWDILAVVIFVLSVSILVVHFVRQKQHKTARTAVHTGNTPKGPGATA